MGEEGEGGGSWFGAAEEQIRTVSDGSTSMTNFCCLRSCSKRESKVSTFSRGRAKRGREHNRTLNVTFMVGNFEGGQR